MALKPPIHSHSIQLQWEPGNGTRYDLMVTALGQAFMGHSHQDTFLVTASNIAKPVSFITSRGGFLHYSYVEEKTGLGIQDACVVTEMVAAVLERDFAVVSDSWYRESVPEFLPIYKAQATKTL